jgi:competence protein ComEA
MDESSVAAKVLSTLSTFKIPLLLALTGSMIIGLSLLVPRLNPEKKAIVVERSEAKTSEASTSLIKVDVAGAVVKPGVYELESEARLEEAIALAGGFSSSANSSWVAKNINLASKITDGQKIYILSLGERDSSGAALGSQTVSDKVNVNFASAKELDSLPGVGAVTAEKIISLRPYNTLEDLLNKKAVGKATYEKIKDLVSVN